MSIRNVRHALIAHHSLKAAKEWLGSEITPKDLARIIDDPRWSEAISLMTDVLGDGEEADDIDDVIPDVVFGEEANDKDEGRG